MIAQPLRAKTKLLLIALFTVMSVSTAIAADLTASMAKQEFDRGNYDKVLKLLANKNDIDSLVLRNRARHCFAVNDDDCLFLAREKYPDNYKAMFGTAMAEIDRRQYDKAQGWVEKGLRIAPGDAEALAMSGLCKVRMGAERDGFKLLTKAVKTNESDEVVLEMTAAAYDSMLKSDLAGQYYAKLCQHFGTHPRAWTLRGRFFSRVGKKNEATECFSHAITLNPRFEEAYTCRAKIYFHDSDFKRAIDDTSKCIELNSGGDQEIECLRVRASCYIAEKMPQKAVDDLKRFLVLNKVEIYPAFAGQEDAYLDMARAYSSMHKFDSAEGCLSRLKKMHKRGADVLEVEASIANLKGNYAEALKDYEKLRDQEGDDPALLQTIERLKNTVAKSEKNKSSK